jgi:peptidoglycan/xylan/chitin deacetylase (PgdA/CDA1 family)
MIADVVGRLRGAARRFSHRREHKALILLYHRIADPLVDPWALCVTPRHFEEHLAVIQRYAMPMQLGAVPAALLAGTLPRRAIIVTFDDGYADNLYRAKPALVRHGLPATVFLTTGAIGGVREFWWDELERLLLRPGIVPARLQLYFNDSLFEWNLGEASCYREEAAWQHRYWRAYESAPSARHALYRSLWERLHPLTDRERQHVLSQLRAWVGVEPSCRESHRMLSLLEVADLVDGGLIDVGAHTVTHPALSALPRVAQQEEIGRSKAQVEAMVGGPITSFSYPFGRRCDYTAETVAIVREAAFSCACSNFVGIVTALTDPFQMPRVQVRDWDGVEFARRLSRWFTA